MVLFRLALSGMRSQVLWYGLGLAVWGGLDVVLFPTVRETIAAVEYPQELLAAFGASGGDMSDPRTFFEVEFFSLAPLITATFALFASTAAFAGEESSGTMDLLASFPLSRRRIFAEKVLAIAIAAVGIVALVSCGWVVTLPFANLGSDLTRWDLVVATFAQLPFTAFMIAMGLLLGAVAPSRSTAAASTAGVLIASYLFVLFAALANSVESLRYVSPYYYTDLSGVLSDGPELGHQAVLWALTAVTLWLALRAVEGREYGSERWQLGAVLRTQYRGAAAAEGGAPRLWALSALTPRGRSGRWWAGALLVVVLAGGAAGAAFGYGTGPARERIVTVDGRVDADKVSVLTPTSGIVRLVTVAEGDDVQRGQAIGWMVNALDSSVQPVRAPITGRVTSVPVQAGQVQPVGIVFAVVYDLQSLHVALEVEENDINDIVTGQQVALTIAAAGLDTTAQVGAVATAPLSSSTARSGQASKYEVTCPLPSADPRVGIGMLVKARIRVAPADAR
jgi:ABC-2 type transport system permease protein